MIKKSNYVLIVVCYFLVNPALTTANEVEQSILADTFEQDYMGDLDGFAGDVFGTEHTRAQATSASIVNIITGPGIKNAFYASIYHRSHPLIDRSPNSLPFFQFFPDNVHNKTLLSCQAQFFYNQIAESFYNKENAGINGYVNMDLHTEVQEIDDTLLENITVSSLFQLFDKVKVQERQVGVMFLLQNNIAPDWTISATIPLSYLERNFYLNEAEVAAIKENQFFKDVDGDYFKFARDHLVSDKFGVGDLKCYLEKTIYTTARSEYNIGIEATVPTSFSIAKGLIGNSFDENKPNPTFNVHTDLLNLAEGGAPLNEKLAKKNMEDFFTGALDRLSTLLLERKLGNGRHFAAGPYLKSHLIFNQKATLTSKMSAEFSLPWQEKRFFKIALNKARLNAIFNNEAPTDAEATQSLEYLSNVAIDKLYLRGYDTTVLPGIVLQSTSRLAYRSTRWTLAGGSDFWYKTKEWFINVHTTDAILETLDLKNAHKPFAVQNILWVSLERNKNEEKYWDLSFKVAGTTFSTGIGNSITLGFQLSHDF